MDKELTENLESHISQYADRIPPELKEKFCKIWPTVAEGLKSVEEILKLIPGGSVAIPFIEAAVNIGNLIHKAVCGS